jgi:hypothetical protein
METFRPFTRTWPWPTNWRAAAGAGKAQLKHVVQTRLQDLQHLLPVTPRRRKARSDATKLAFEQPIVIITQLLFLQQTSP